MNNVSIDDISTIRESKTFEFLGNDGVDSLQIGDTLQNFNTNSSDILKGEAWDKVRAKYGKYNELLSKHSNISTDMSSAIQGIISELESAMNGYDSIDVSKLDELKIKKTSCESRISEIQSMLNATRFDLKTFRFVPVYDNAQLSASLNEEQKILNEINKLIGVIENIKAICAKGESKLNNLLEEMNTISMGVENIVVSNSVTFQG